MLIASCTVALCLLTSVLAGFAFGVLRFRGRRFLMALTLSVLMMPATVLIIPDYVLASDIHWIDTYWVQIIPWGASVFGIFLVRQYARSIPDELLEAARLEGAGEARVFASIVLPLLKPILVTLAIFTFLNIWNDFMWPLIVLTDSRLQTLPVALALLSREHVQDNELMMAGSVVTVLPPLLLFLGLQRYYIQGLLLGSVKG